VSQLRSLLFSLTSHSHLLGVDSSAPVRRRTKLKVDVGGDFTSGHLAGHCDRGVVTVSTDVRSMKFH